MSILLIHPPVAKACEPPAGIAKLAGVLLANDIHCKVVDANIEGILYLLGSTISAKDNWTRQALRNLSVNITALRNIATFRNIDHYKRIVRDLNRVLSMSGQSYKAKIGLADFQHQELSPVSSTDLLTAAAKPETNPFYSYFSTHLLPVIEHYNPRVLGISLNYLSQALCTFALIGLIRQVYPQLKCILGGGLITSWMKNPNWNNPFTGLVYECVAGPGESWLLSYFGKNKNLIISARPDYSQFSSGDYFAPGFILPYSASRGCYWNRCNFCPESAERNPYSPVPFNQVMHDLENLCLTMSPALIHFLDNAISPALLRRICTRKFTTPWYGYTRFTRELEDLDFCMALHQSGCIMLKLGLESGDQKVLDLMQKGINLDCASRVLKNLKKAGISTYIYLLFGTPDETIHQARKTMNFVIKHMDCINFINPAIFNLPRSSCEAAELQTHQFYCGDLSLYTDFNSPTGWNRKQVRQFLDREFKRHPVIGQILRQNPLIFTSNHAPFFVK